MNVKILSTALWAPNLSTYPSTFVISIYLLDRCTQIQLDRKRICLGDFCDVGRAFSHELEQRNHIL